MALTVSANARMVGNLFSSMNSNLAGSSSGNLFSGIGMMGGFNFSDYASIRNGSYHKLLNSYYSLDSDSDSSSKTSSSSKAGSEHKYWDFQEAKKVKTDYNYWDYKTMSTSKESAKKLASAESAAGKLYQAADALLEQGSKSVFNEVTKKDSAGNQSTGYDTDAIYKAVSSFVDSYNGLLKDVKDSKVMAISSSARSIMDYSKQVAGDLAAIGIGINSEDNTLVLNEAKFKEADMAAVKKLFQGTGSYAYKVATKASAIDYHAQYEASKANTYNSGGRYSNNYSSGSVWNDAV